MQIFSKYLVSRKELTASEKQVGALEKEITSARLFVKKIEEGYLDTVYPEVDEDNVTSESLPGSLISMRNQLKNLNITESQRTWSSEGLAFFSELLQKNQQDLEDTCHDIISNLVKYLKVNQGAIYIVNQEDRILELKACYAYDRRKYIEKNIKFGEGLIGQIYLEKESLILKDVPENYVNIKSGLGEATPRSLVIVPLKTNEEVMGIIELASFKQIEQYQIDFIEKLGESIASIISNIRITAKTQHLLAQSQQQAESLRSQEEELRQNMEELSATQEEMQRVMKEVQGNEVFIRDLVNSTNDTIFAIDKNYKILICNSSTKENYKAYGFQIEKGFNVLELFSNEDKQKYRAFYDRALGGEFFEVTEHYKFKDKDQYFVIVYSPLRDVENEIIGAACFGKDITETIASKERVEKLLAETQEQAMALKQQEEVLLQNMEELTSTQEEMQKTLDATEAKETFIRNLINASIDSIFVIDRDYKLLQFNKTFAKSLETLGVHVEAGSDVFIILSEEEKENHKALYDRVFQGETFQVTEHIQVTDSYYLSTYTPIFDDKQGVSACAVFAKDVTEVLKSKKQVDELLQESKRQEEKLQQQMETTSMLNNELDARMAVLNESTILSESDIYGTITYVNDKFCEVSQFTREELIGKPHKTVRHPDSPKAFFKEFWKTIQSGKTFRGFLKNKKKDGSAYYVDAVISSVLDENGKVVKYIAARYVIEDVELAEKLIKEQGFTAEN